MRPALQQRWSSCKSTVVRLREVSAQSSELQQVSSWRRNPATQNASCEAALRAYASQDSVTVVSHMQSSLSGLPDAEALQRLKIAGSNILTSKKPPTKLELMISSVNNSFNYLLLIIAIVTVAVPPPEWATFGVIVAMVLISCVVRYWQELRSTVAAVQLQANLLTKVYVRRICDGHGSETIAIDEKSLVPGDILLLNPGDGIPADCYVLESSNLSVSQSGLTGESEPQRKGPTSLSERKKGAIFDLENIAFMGTHVISGTGVAIILRTGDNSFIATIMQELNKTRPANAFQRSIKQVSYMMAGFMAIIFPIVLAINGITTKDWMSATFFAISIAVGLIPGMLPAIMNTNLARGAISLAKKQAIVKRLDSIQNLGAMTVLCCDKTGTLTKDEIALRQCLDNHGNESDSVFKFAYTNAANQSGNKNSIDSAIIQHANTIEKEILMGVKIGEQSFTFESRRSSCIIEDSGRYFLICKGASEEIFSLCTHIRFGSEVVLINDQNCLGLLKRADALNSEGNRVILVASRILENKSLEELADPQGLDYDMVLEGLLTFLDPPKDDAKASITQLQALGADVRILSGDNLGVAMKVCRSLEIVKEIDEEHIPAINGQDLAQLEVEEFDRVVKNCKVFAKLTPAQKGQVVMSLKKQGEVVGMLGDGINDCVALRDADAGISVDTGANAAKDCADVILTKKELSIIVDCVRVGRVTQGNTIKYIKMVASSNFGNVFSILISSAWLPYQPMTALQILIQNLLYDMSQIAIPWDNMDEEFVAVPQGWNILDLLRFIVIMGPTSSTVDVCTFALNYFYYGIRSVKDLPGVKIAHTHWFLVGLFTQTIVVYLLRTAKIPFIQSNAAKPVVYSTVAILAVGFALPYIPGLSRAFGFVHPAPSFLGFLAAQILLYCIVVQLLKMLYIKLFRKWL